MENMKIALGADHAGFKLKEEIKTLLEKKGVFYEDFGCFSTESCDYPDYAKKVATVVQNNMFNRGILVCGSGIGMCIAANRFQGIRAALCWNKETAKSSRTHNDSNVLCLGERQISIEEGLELVNIWLEEEFQGGRHQKRVDLIEG